MADKPATKMLAGRVHGKLQEGNMGVGFDPTIIIAIITAIMQLFSGCKTPASLAHQRALNVAKGQGFGHRLDRLRLRRIIDSNASDDQQDEIEAALLDSMGDTAEVEFAAALDEAK